MYFKAGNNKSAQQENNKGDQNNCRVMINKKTLRKEGTPEKIINESN